MSIASIKIIKKLTKRILRKIPIVKYLIDRRDVIRHRYNTAQNYNKNSFIYKQDAFVHIYKENAWHSGESRSGGGSEISSTVKIRKALPLIWKKYGIKTFLDVPCGDFNWMKEVDKTDIKYIGGDIVEEAVARNNELYKTQQIEFIKIDITKDTLPKVDMIFCKDCLQHLSYESVIKSINNFVKSGSKYVMLTSYPLTIKNHDILDGDYRALNLFKEPFSLPTNYLYKVREQSRGKDVELDKTMYLWDMNVLSRFF
jgi:SAM-dependent methyltransferase